MRQPRHVKWNKRKGKKWRPTYAACFLLACQPPTDLAINLQYKPSLISGSLILKWIIIWLRQSSLLNVKCLQFVKWPLFRPWSEPHVQRLTVEWAPWVEIYIGVNCASGVAHISEDLMFTTFPPSLLSFLISLSLLFSFCFSLRYYPYFSSILLCTRGYKDSLAQHGQRGEGTVPSINPGQGHGGPARGAGRDHHRQHHPQRCQR